MEPTIILEADTPTSPIPNNDGQVKKYYRKAAHRYVDIFYLLLVFVYLFLFSHWIRK